jgi:nucleoside-diphosphate-sugar epimerase
MKIFVTGASGFVGGAFTVAAVKSGHVVLAMARSDRSAQAVAARGATPVRCELGKVDAAHVAGCDAIVHCAAFVEEWGTREEFWEGNVTGTAQLLDVAARAGVPRFIHISSESAVLAGQPLQSVDETYPYPKTTPYLYAETKAEAERRVVAATRPGFTTLVLRPRLIWGPGDLTILPAAVEMVKRGAFMWLDGGRAMTSITHIDNLVHAMMLSLEKGRGGEIYFVTDGEDMTLRDFLTAYLKTQGVAPSGRSMPSWVADAAAAALEVVWRTLGLRKAPPLTRFAAMVMSRECTIRIDKIRKEMGYTPQISPAKGLAEMPKQ